MSSRAPIRIAAVHAHATSKKLQDEIEALKKKAGEPGKPDVPPPLAPRR